MRLLYVLYVLLVVLTMTASVVTMGFLGDTLLGVLAYGPFAVVTIIMYCRWWR